jgi:hypothetical protein
MPVDDTNVDKALTWLRNRASLGWTDLDRAFAEVQRRAEPGTVVVYLGDGIGTTGDGDPHALGKRLAASGARFACHAVAVGTSYEQPVLEALASLGGGSVRACGADDAPECAQALLAEVAQPALKDLKVELARLRTARRLSREAAEPAGRHQQIVLGRFLPSGSGRRQGRRDRHADGKPVRFRRTSRSTRRGRQLVPAAAVGPPPPRRAARARAAARRCSRRSSRSAPSFDHDAVHVACSCSRATRTASATASSARVQHARRRALLRRGARQGERRGRARADAPRTGLAHAAQGAGPARDRAPGQGPARVERPRSETCRCSILNGFGVPTGS